MDLSILPSRVFVGATLALAANAAIGLVAGASVMQAIPVHSMRRAGGILFILLGLFYVVRD